MGSISSETVDSSQAGSSRPKSTFEFTISSPELSSSSKFGPRLGHVSLTRRDTADASGKATSRIDIQTPGVLTNTSRGVIPHLSRDNYPSHSALKWMNVPFESFLEHNPPVPTLQVGEQPLHAFLGFQGQNHILSMIARDPNEAKEMPVNQNHVVSVSTLRGVRKLSPDEWRTYALQLHPDLIFALADTPFTNPPYSQKRLMKSIDRSAAWIGRLFNPPPAGAPASKAKNANPKTATSTAATPSSPATNTTTPPQPTTPSQPLPPIIAPLIGSTSPRAREAYAHALLEHHIPGPDLDQIRPYTFIDQGLAGYSVDLAVLRCDLSAAAASTSASPAVTQGDTGTDADANAATFNTLLRASLAPLPSEKPRIVFGARSPHEILKLVRDTGVDLFDAAWVVEMGTKGVALDFAFPVRGACANSDRTTGAGKRPIGHNLYATEYAMDFAALGAASGFVGAGDGVAGSPPADREVCTCIACSPRVHDGDRQLIRHGFDSDVWISPGGVGAEDLGVEGSGRQGLEELEKEVEVYRPPHTRAYVHHLLHTHEMGAHAFLVSHNIAVLEAFLRGVRGVLSRIGGGDVTPTSTPTAFEEEVEKFLRVYERPGALLGEAEKSWREVDLARGKGRLAREREKGDHVGLADDLEV
ncbi:hypothetical protein FA15DRAFT_760512 [Coprinopsis marcescibilis]|uniref:tRNA-guanine(15) transglycosylase-like domain-containing protein n=1 Tax=Coprinopsis marcescibilis TaxID=230819 RepID=A0A5C3KFX0_COPMA|nr:hypothetical protein FA15DRAFT_760512 [Coprinopsis marcescibilis]